MTDLTFHHGYRPGLISDVICLHMDYYAKHWNFGVEFETKLAAEMGEFLARMNVRDLVFSAYAESLAGSVTIDGNDPAGAHLRWFIVDPEMAGKGLGNQLMREAVTFAQNLDQVSTLWLTTFKGLDAAERLYLKHGFRLISENNDDQWQGGVIERRYELRF